MKYLIDKLNYLKVIEAKNIRDFVQRRICDDKAWFYDECQKWIHKSVNVMRSEWITRDIGRKGAQNEMWNVEFTSKITVE